MAIHPETSEVYSAPHVTLPEGHIALRGDDAAPVPTELRAKVPVETTRSQQRRQALHGNSDFVNVVRGMMQRAR